MLLTPILINAGIWLFTAIYLVFNLFDVDSEVDEMMEPIAKWKLNSPTQALVVKIWSRATVLSLPIYYLMQVFS